MADTLTPLATADTEPPAGPSQEAMGAAAKLLESVVTRYDRPVGDGGNCEYSVALAGYVPESAWLAWKGDREVAIVRDELIPHVALALDSFAAWERQRLAAMLESHGQRTAASMVLADEQVAEHAVEDVAEAFRHSGGGL